MGTLGLIMIFIAMLRYRFRARWLFWFLLIYGILLCLNPPVGPAIALVIGIYLAIHAKSLLRSEY